MCNRYTDAQCALCPHRFPECTGEACVQCLESVSSANAGVTLPSHLAATHLLPVRHLDMCQWFQSFSGGLEPSYEKM